MSLSPFQSFKRLIPFFQETDWFLAECKHAVIQKFKENENLNAIFPFFLFFIVLIPLKEYFHSQILFNDKINLTDINIFEK